MSNQANEPDDLDGCALDFIDHADDELTASLRPLFPDGVANEYKAAEWRQIAATQEDC